MTESESVCNGWCPNAPSCDILDKIMVLFDPWRILDGISNDSKSGEKMGARRVPKPLKCTKLNVEKPQFLRVHLRVQQTPFMHAGSQLFLMIKNFAVFSGKRSAGTPAAIWCRLFDCRKYGIESFGANDRQARV